MKRIVIALLALSWSQSSPAVEISPLPATEPAALLREAEESSPALRAARARLEAARYAPSVAQAPPDPEVSVTYVNDGLSQFTLGEREFALLAVNWAQEIRSSGKRKQAAEVADRASEASERELERLRLEVLATVKGVYADLFRLDRRAEILEEIRTALGSLEETARRRYDVGQGIQENVLKAQTEILILEAETIRLAQDRKEAEARLNAAIGRAAETPVGPADLPLAGGLPAEAELRALLTGAESPEIGLLEAEVKRSQAAAGLARLEQNPDMFWSASYQYRGDLDPMVMAMFGVRLPLFRDRKQAQALAQAESESVAASQELANLRLVTESEVRQLIARTERADRLLKLYDEGILPQASSALESARVSYSVGRIGMLDILSDLKVLLEARRDRASLEAERMQALAALEPLLGRELVRAPERGEAAGGGHAALR